MKKTMTIESRKTNRLKEWDYSSPGIYFITICTQNRANYFGHIVGGGDFDAPQIILSPWGEIAQKHLLSQNNSGVVLDKFVIMPNHIHLLIKIEDGTSPAPSPTNAIIPSTISLFKRKVNHEIGRNIFQRSFHDHIIRNEHDYKEIWEYIDSNPARWASDDLYIE